MVDYNRTKYDDFTEERHFMFLSISVYFGLRLLE